MAYGKWIGSFLGFINTHSVLGAIAGFVLGAFFDAISEKRQQTDKESSSSAKLSFLVITVVY